GPPCCATRSLSADSNITSEPSSSVKRTNSATAHPQRRPSAAHGPHSHFPAPRPIPLHPPGSSAAAENRLRRWPRVFHREPPSVTTGRSSDNGPLSLPPAIAFVPLA